MILLPCKEKRNKSRRTEMKLVYKTNTYEYIYNCVKEKYVIESFERSWVCDSYLCSWIYSRGLLSRWRNLSTILFFPTPCNYTNMILERHFYLEATVCQSTRILPKTILSKLCWFTSLLMKTKLANICSTTSKIQSFFFYLLLSTLVLSYSYFKRSL